MLCRSPWTAAKATLREKKYKAINCFLIKQERITINKLNVCFQNLKNEKQSKPKESWVKN